MISVPSQRSHQALPAEGRPGPSSLKKIQNDSFKDFINSRKIQNYSFKKNIHSNEKCIIARDQRVPDTRPEPEIFFNTRSIPDLFSKSSGISGIGYFRKRSFWENFFCSKLVRMLSPNIFLNKHVNSTNHIKFYHSPPVQIQVLPFMDSSSSALHFTRTRFSTCHKHSMPALLILNSYPCILPAAVTNGFYWGSQDCPRQRRRALI